MGFVIGTGTKAVAGFGSSGFLCREMIDFLFS
jgi:hypothetical protein